MVSGTGVITGEDLIEGHSWKMGVVLLDTVGVGLLSCVGAVFDLQLPTGKRPCDRRTRGCTAAKRHDFEKHAIQDHQPPGKRRCGVSQGILEISGGS